MIRIEYTAQVAAVRIPNRIPAASPPISPPAPSATSPTPANESAAPAQKRRGSTSVPKASPIRAAKIGVAARISAITEADVVLSA